MASPQPQERPVLTGWNKLFHSSKSSTKSPVPVPADKPASSSLDNNPPAGEPALPPATTSATAERPTAAAPEAPPASRPGTLIVPRPPPAVPLATQRLIERQNDEFLGKMTTCLRNRDLMGMGTLFLETSPGEDTKLDNVYIREIIRRALADPASYYEMHETEIYRTIYFRWEYGILTDYLLAKLRLRVPNFRICLLWDRRLWEAEADRRMLAERREELWVILNWALERRGFGLRPGVYQGAEFVRPREYLAAAIIQANRSIQDSLELVDQSIEFFEKARDGSIP